MAEEVIDPELAGGTQDTAAETPDTTADTAAAPAADAPATDANADASAADANADASAADANADASAADANADASAASTSGGTEYFNYEGIKSCFDELDAEFAAFAKTLETLNNTVQEKINVGPDSGVLGGYGTSIINLWNSNASTFGDFYKNFESWSATVISLANANGGFEGLTADMFSNHQSTGGTLDGVHDLRVTTAIGQGALRVDGQDIYDENNTITIGDFTYVRSIDEFGNTVIKKYDKNGNLVEVKLVTVDGKNPELTKDPDTGYYIYTFKDENGKEIKYYYDDKGNVVQIEYTDENGVRHIITHTDENDNYNKDITEDYYWDEEKGEWVLDTSKQQEEAQAYIDSLKDPTTGEIDINNITQADLDKLSPEARQLVIDALADKFMEGFNNPTEAINAFGYDNFKNLPKELQEAIKSRGDGSGSQPGEGEQQPEGNPWDDGREVNNNNDFGGKTYKTDDGTLYMLDADGKLVATNKDGKYYDAEGNEIGGPDEYNQWVEDRNNNGGNQPGEGEQQPSGNPWDGGTVQTETNSYGGQTIEGTDGATYYLDADGKLVASSKDGKYYAPDGTEIGGEEAYNNWLRDNGRPYGGSDEHGDYTATYENGTEIRTYEHADGSKTTREIRYDTDGDPKEIVDKDAQGNVTMRTEYDVNGKPSQVTHYMPDGTQEIDYYQNGEYVESQHIEDGNSYNYTRDPSVDPGDSSATFDVDGYEGVVNRTENNGTVTYEFGPDSPYKTVTVNSDGSYHQEFKTGKTVDYADHTTTTNEGYVTTVAYDSGYYPTDGQGNIIKSVVTDRSGAIISTTTTYSVASGGVDKPTQRIEYSNGNINTTYKDGSTEVYTSNRDTYVRSYTNGITGTRVGDGAVTYTYQNPHTGRESTFNWDWDGDGFSSGNDQDKWMSSSSWEEAYSIQQNAYRSASKIHYVNNNADYTNALANAKPGEAIVLHTHRIQIDLGGGGTLGEGFEVDAGNSNSRGTFDVVVIKNADGTFSVPGCGKRDYTYAEMTGSGNAGDNRQHWADY